MKEDPVVDGRDSDDLLRDAREMAPYYTEEWDPESDDSGTVLLKIFSELAEAVVGRLDRVPEKHFVAFLDALGVSRHPPQSARLPLTLQVSDGAEGNVAIPAGTQAIAEATEDRPEQTFEVVDGDGFEATSSNITRAYSVDPSIDGIFEHWESLEEGAGSELFGGEDRQEHILYLGHDDLLNLKAGATIQVTMGTDTPERVLRDCLVWEFYGEIEENGETKMGWHQLHSGGDETSGQCPWSEIRPVEEFVEKLSPRLKRYGYELAEHPPGLRYRLLSSIADDVRERTSGVTHAGRRGGNEVSIPRNLLPPEEMSQELAGMLRWELKRLREGLQEASEAADTRRSTVSEGPAELTLELPGAISEKTVSGIETRWIRCRIPDEEMSSGLFGVEIRSVHLGVGARAEDDPGGLTPDAMFSNDIPLAVERDGGDLYPFGKIPQPRTTFYVASEEAFTKKGTTVTIRFEPSEVDGADGGGETPDVSWEYWNGSGWTRLPLVHDETEGLATAGAVSFEVPHDLDSTGVSGHEGRWIRVRLVGGDYGRARYEETNQGSWKRVTEDVNPPRFGGVTISYAREAPPAHLLTKNNLSFSDDLADGEPAEFRPFTGVPDESQTLYLGFDRALSDGPINLFFPLEETEYPDEFSPRMRWEYYENPGKDEWSKLDIRDATRGLSKAGIVSLVFPGETSPVELFGQELHWIRARVTEDEFAPPADTVFVPMLRREITTPRGVPEPYRASLRTEPPTGDPIETPPELRDLHLNTGWAYNVRTVTGEIVGSSDGSGGQEFVVANSPVTEEEVWVDELSALSEARRRELVEARPSEVDEVTGPGGELREFWVKWQAVEDFLGSGEDSRHYTLDRATGRLSFGNGARGKIPPRGRDNVRASYKTGGGAEGNVEADAITGLKSSIPFIDAVTNPVPGGGGAEEESMERVRRRAPKQLRDRRKSVFTDDFERIAMAASRELARAKCIPGMDEAGDHSPGWVTLLIVPNTRRKRPAPSVELKRRALEALRERAPATLVDPERPRLVVRGPSFVEASVEATLKADGVESISTLEETVTKNVQAFLHPLSGGPEGDGWDFGELPHLSDLYALLERIDGVDHVEDLSLTFAGKGEGEDVTVTEGEPNPRTAPDALVFSGAHEITVIGGI